jgi:hypothetical protein
MAIKVDGTNNKIIFYAGTGTSTTITSDPAATPWTATLPPTAGTAGQVLTTDGSGNLSWSAGGGAAITVADDTTTNAARYPLFSSITTGSLTTAYVASTEYQFNPSTGVLSAPQMESTQGMHLNSNTIAASYTLPAGFNALSAGPITQGAGVVVTVPAGQAWVVV